MTLLYFELLITGPLRHCVYSFCVILYCIICIYCSSVTIRIFTIIIKSRYVHFVVGPNAVDETSSTKKSRNSLPPSSTPVHCKPVQNRFRCPMKRVQKSIQC